MNALDAGILTAAVGAGLGGWRLGFLARAVSWVGLAVGIAAGALLCRPVLEAMEGAEDAQRVVTAVFLLAGGGLVGQAVGLVAGARLHLALPLGGARLADRVAGVAAGVAGVLAVVWLLVPAMADAPGAPARLARGSAIARELAAALPVPPAALRSLEELVGTDLPDVLGAFERAPELGPPPAAAGLDAAVAEAVAASTVKVEARACGRLQDGSGAVLAPELVVTNAHVVAGADGVTVERHPDGEVLDAEVVAFDPGRDLAVLAVPGIDRPALPLGDAEPGDVGAVFGHPGGGTLELSPYLVGREVTATGRDVYDTTDTRRQVLFLAAELAPGDSGGPLVAPTGEVVGVAFAIAPDDPTVAYALTVEEVRAVLAGTLAPTPAGGCLR